MTAFKSYWPRPLNTKTSDSYPYILSLPQCFNSIHRLQYVCMPDQITMFNSMQGLDIYSLTDVLILWCRTFLFIVSFYLHELKFHLSHFAMEGQITRVHYKFNDHRFTKVSLKLVTYYRTLRMGSLSCAVNRLPLNRWSLSCYASLTEVHTMAGLTPPSGSQDTQVNA